LIGWRRGWDSNPHPPFILRKLLKPRTAHTAPTAQIAGFTHKTHTRPLAARTLCFIDGNNIRPALNPLESGRERSHESHGLKLQGRCLVEPGRIDLPTSWLQNMFGEAISLILRHGWRPIGTQKHGRNAQVVPVLYSFERLPLPASAHFCGTPEGTNPGSASCNDARPRIMVAPWEFEPQTSTLSIFHT
jgi:hypothetical protein